MTSTLRQTLDQLDALREAATPGPWQYDPETPGEMWDVDLDVILGGCENSADAALIVAAVNHLPHLTAAVRALLDLADELDADGTRSAELAYVEPRGSFNRGSHLGRALARKAAASRIRAALSGADTGTTA